MYSVSIRNMANIAVPMMKPATFAPLTVRICRRPNRISGSRCRSSQPTNPARRTSEPTKNAIVSAASQPSWPACVIA